MATYLKVSDSELWEINEQITNLKREVSKTIDRYQDICLILAGIEKDLKDLAKNADYTTEEEE